MKFSISLNGSRGYSRAHLIMTANLLAYQVKRKIHESTDANLLVPQITLGTHADFKLKKFVLPAIYLVNNNSGLSKYILLQILKCKTMSFCPQAVDSWKQ